MAQKPLKAVILTALSVEFKEVRRFVTDSQQVRHSLGNVYEQGTFRANGREWQVGIVETGAGDSKSALQTERAVNFFDPDVVIFVGVAGGIKDVGIGDVVASTKVYGYESGKAEKEFKPRPEIGLSGFSFIEEAKAEARSEQPAWLARLDAAPDEPLPKLKVGPIAVGEKVVASKESGVYQFLRRNYSDALAVEMEGYGFLDAVNARSKPLPAIVVRGISDLIDNKNDETEQEPEDIRQQKASRHASALAFQLLASYDPFQGITTGTTPLLTTTEDPFRSELFDCFQESDLALLQKTLDTVLGASDRSDTLGEIKTLSGLKKALRGIETPDLIAWVEYIIQNAEQFCADDDAFSAMDALSAWYEEYRPREEPLEDSSSEEDEPLGYLLVTLDPVDDGDNVWLFAELYGAGETLCTNLVPPDTKCSIDKVCDILSDVIPRAGDVQAVEIFLPWQHLMQPVHAWKIRSSQRARGRRNQKELWRIPRNTVVRSLDRLQDKLWSEEWLKGLENRYQQLQVLEALLVEDHVCCRDCLTEDLFDGALDQKFVFKFLATLPEDQDDLADLLYTVIESKVPIWLWAYEQPAASVDFVRRVDTLLTPENLRESAMLAQSILAQRPGLRELGLLFDCHIRIPRLPTLAVDESGRLHQPAA